jgi:hypothetical protein
MAGAKPFTSRPGSKKRRRGKKQDTTISLKDMAPMT